MAAIEEFISEDTLHTFLKAQEEDSALGKVIEALKNGTAFPSSTVPGLKKTFLQDGLLCRKFRASCSEVGCVTGYQVIRVIWIFAKTYPFE